MAQVITLVEKDTLPILTGSTGLNLTGYTVKLKINYPTPVTVNGALSATPTDGTFTITFPSSTTLVAGSWEAEIMLTNASTQEQTYQGIILHILPRIV